MPLERVSISALAEQSHRFDDCKKWEEDVDYKLLPTRHRLHHLQLVNTRVILNHHHDRKDANAVGEAVVQFQDE